MKHSRNIGYLLENSLTEARGSGFYSDSGNFTLGRLKEGLNTISRKKRIAANANNNGEKDSALYHRYSKSMPYRQMLLSVFGANDDNGNNNNNSVPIRTENDFKAFMILVSCIAGLRPLEILDKETIDMTETINNETKLSNLMAKDADGMFIKENGKTLNTFMTVNKNAFCCWDEELGFYIPMCQFPFEEFKDSGLIAEKTVTSRNGDILKAYEWKFGNLALNEIIRKNKDLIYLFFRINTAKLTVGVHGTVAQKLINEIYAEAVNNLQQSELDILDSEIETINEAIAALNGDEEDREVNKSGNYSAKKIGVLWIPVKPYPFTEKVLLVKSQNSWANNVFIGNGRKSADCFVVPPLNKAFFESIMKKDANSRKTEINAVQIYYDSQSKNITAIYNGTTKTYSGEEIVEISVAPAMAIYPKLPEDVLPYWNKFYFYKSANVEQQRGVEFSPGYFDKAGEKEKICAYCGGTIDSYLLGRNGVEDDINRLDKYSYKYCESAFPFEFIKVKSGNVDLGYLLFDDRVAFSSKTTGIIAPDGIKAAIDFGSTNTTMRILKPNAKNPESVECKKEFFAHLSNDSDKNNAGNIAAFSQTFYLYGAGNLKKMPSYAQLFRTIDLNNQGEERVPMIFGRALEINEDIHNTMMIKDFFVQHGVREHLKIVGDLKLQRYIDNYDLMGSVAADIFLKDCMELLLLNSMKNGCLIPKFYASYPGNNSGVYTANKNCWICVANFLNGLINSAKIKKHTSYNQKNKIEPATRVLESVSVAAYMSKYGYVPDSDKKVFVDIGGGTTDVSLFHKQTGATKTTVFETSYKYAGNNILRSSVSQAVVQNMNNNPFETIFSRTGDWDLNTKLAVFDCVLDQAENLEEINFVLEYCLANGGLKRITNENSIAYKLSEVIRIKYLASLFYVKKWIEAHSGNDFFKDIDKIDFVGGGSIAFGIFFNDSERDALLKETISDHNNNFSCDCSATADKPEVVEGAFWPGEVDIKEDNFDYISADDCDSKVAGILDEFFIFINELLGALNSAPINDRRKKDDLILLKTVFGRIAKLTVENNTGSDFIPSFSDTFNTFKSNVISSAIVKAEDKFRQTAIADRIQNSSMCRELDLVGFAIKAFADMIDKYSKW